MASHWLPLLLLSSSFLLAGCADDSDTRMDTPSESMNSLAVVSTEEAPPAPPALEPVTVVCEITRTNIGTTTGYGLNIDRAAIGIDECPLEGLFDGNTTWAMAGLVEATWTNQPSQTGTDLWVESDACQVTLPPAPCDFPSTMGTTSPLRLELDGEALRGVEGQNALVMVSGQGFVMDLTYTLHITLFPDAIPDGYSAIPA